MPENIEQKITFAICREGQGDGCPVLLLGIPRAAWVYMKEGKTHHFDLSSIGIPLKLMLFGAKDHDGAMATMQQAIAASGQAYLDERQRDFSIKPKEACSVCAHVLGSVAFHCGNRQSEFFEKPVHPIGWCPEFKPQSGEAA